MRHKTKPKSKSPRNAQFEDAPAPEVTPIYPEHELFALVSMGDGERFVKLFRTAWEKIPQPDRDFLLDEWKAEREVLTSKSQGMKWPRIVLKKKHYAFEQAFQAHHISFASTSPIDTVFFAPTFGVMPDEVFCVIIAHELAHLLLRRKHPKKKTPQGFGKSYGDLEKYVDGRIAEWGFDVEGCEKWCAENQMLLIDVYFMANLAPEST